MARVSDLHKKYNEKIQKELMDQLGIKNVMAVP